MKSTIFKLGANIISIYVIILFSHIPCTGQVNTIESNKMTIVENKVNYQGGLWKYSAMDHIFKKNTVAYSLYQESQETRKESRIFAIAGLVGWTSSYLGLRDIELCLYNCIDQGPTKEELLLSYGFTTALIGTIGSITKLKKSISLKRKSLDVWNAGNDIGERSDIELEFFGSSSGVGLLLRF